MRKRAFERLCRPEWIFCTNPEILRVAHSRTDNPSQFELGVPSPAVYTYQGWQLGFWGPAEFTQLVDKAKKQLEIQDPELLKSMSERYTVIYSPKRVFSFPLWKYGGVSDSFMVWKAEGVLAAWIYLYFQSLTLTKGRWFLSAPQSQLERAKMHRRRRESG
jgi:hypothetical protein